MSNIDNILFKYYQHLKTSTPIFESLKNINYKIGLQDVRFLINSVILNITQHNDFIDPVCNNWLLGWKVQYSDGTISIVMNPEYFGHSAVSPDMQLKEAQKIFPTDVELQNTQQWDAKNIDLLEESVTYTEINDVTPDKFNDRHTALSINHLDKRVIEYIFNDGKLRTFKQKPQKYVVLMLNDKSKIIHVNNTNINQWKSNWSPNDGNIEMQQNNMEYFPKYDGHTYTGNIQSRTIRSRHMASMASYSKMSLLENAYIVNRLSIGGYTFMINNDQLHLVHNNKSVGKWK